MSGTRWAAVALVVGLLAVGCSGGGDEGGASGSDEVYRTLAVVPSVERLSTALDDESRSSALTIAGLDEIPVMDDFDLDSARAATDEALDRVDAPGELAVAELPDDLVRLRRDVDLELADGSSPSDIDAADTMHAGYDAAIEGIWAEFETAALEVADDPGLLRGFELTFTTGRMTRLAGTLVRLLTFSGIDDDRVVDADEIRDIAAAFAEIEDIAAELRSQTAPPFADVIDSEFPARLHEELTTLTEAALRTGTVDVSAVVGLAADLGYLELQHAVNDVLAEEFGSAD